MRALKRRATTLLLATVAGGASAGSAAPPVFAAAPPCRAAQLALDVDRIGAPEFTGTSHSGAYAIVTNTGADACEFSPLAALSMRADDDGTAAVGAVAGARFMHPGPAVVPIELAGHATAATRLRWIDADVYGTGRAVRARAVALVLATVDGSVVRTIPSTTLWGDRTPVTFERERFTTELRRMSATSTAGGVP